MPPFYLASIMYMSDFGCQIYIDVYMVAAVGHVLLEISGYDRLSIDKRPVTSTYVATIVLYAINIYKKHNARTVCHK
jgi:hypothetical protein